MVGKRGVQVPRLHGAMKFEPVAPSSFLWLVCSEASGGLLLQDLTLGQRGVDAACWHWDQRRGVLTSAVDPSVVLSLAADGTLTKPDGGRVEVPSVADEGWGESGQRFGVLRGPCELPSASLSHLREHGWVVLPELLPPAWVRDLKETFTRMQEKRLVC